MIRNNILLSRNKDNYERLVESYIENNLWDLTFEFKEKHLEFVRELIHNECKEWPEYAKINGMDEDDTELDYVTDNFIYIFPERWEKLVQDTEKFDEFAVKQAEEYYFDGNR